MRIYVGGLWSKVGRADLEELVKQSLRGPWYRLHAPRGRMADCELLQMVDLRNGDTEFCAVIEVGSSKLGWEVIHFLDGLHVNGHTLNAHKWFPRKGIFDRRVFGEDEAPSLGLDRRDDGRRDRRRQLNVHPLGKRMVHAVRGFERSYGA